jgi:hypothetical protein
MRVARLELSVLELSVVEVVDALVVVGMDSGLGRAFAACVAGR